MALLNRLFSSRKKQQPQKGYGPPVSSQLNRKIFEFNKDQVRILLFRECERRGRKLLFDSKAVKKVHLPNSSQCGRFRTGVKTEETRKGEASYVEITNGFGYQYTRPTSDVKSLGEMIFGSVAMALRGSTFKVHVGGSPSVLMFTKVANSPSKKISDHGLEDSYGSSINSMNDYFSGGTSSSDSKLSTLSGSCPLDVPVPSNLILGASHVVRSVGHHLGSLEADSGCYTNSECSIPGLLTNGSFNAALASPDSRKGSGGSLSSLRRRWLRTASTSLDFDSSQSLLTHADSLASCGSLPACADDKPACRTKLGISVIISLTEHQKETMQEFLLEHAALLESMAVRLHAAVERAYCRKDLFVSMMFDASCDIKQSVEDLLLGPHLPVPLWLGLLSTGAPHTQAQHASIAAGFMQELCQMLEVYDTKDTNFFMSTLITAVLTHHLGWVPTVTPGLHQCLQQPNSDSLKSSSTLSDLPKLHPYNPLWAQAMDLYGALGHPLKTSRTIVMSLASNRHRLENIEKILRITSYFIRCAGIERHEPKLEDYDFHSSLMVCSNLSKPDVAQLLSIDDRTSSSSTLRPLSGKCSPRINVCQSSMPLNHGKVPDIFSLKQKSFNATDTISSKSENSLNIGLKVSSSEVPCKQPSSKGLRRTMSYSSRITSAAVNENKKHKDKIPLTGAYENGEDILPSINCSESLSRLPGDPVGVFERLQSQADDRVSSLSLDKVIFVLGENEDLVGLKGKRRQSIEVTESTKDTIESKGKLQEQPLSFSGSEVESGFSECESFELSPVRSASENLLTPNGKGGDASITCSPSLRSKLWCAKYDKNIGSFTTCRRNILKEDEALPFHDINPQIVTVQPTFIQFEDEIDSSSVVDSNLRSLARSLSVNLPVCLKSNKQELPVSDFCITCGGQVSDVERKENIHPVKDCRHSSSRKNMRRLRRAHSSLCVQSQSKKAVKSITMCQNCHSGIEDPCIVKENRHIQCKELSDRLSSQLLDQKNEPSNVVEIPIPLCPTQSDCPETSCEWGIAGSLFGGVSSHYIPERVLQGCVPMGHGWEMSLRRDLAIEAQHASLDPSVSEAVAIVASVDSWDVQLISSHTYVVDRPGTFGVRAGLSQLVSNMLESVCHMWKLHASPESCLSFIESRLQEMWLRSRALSDLLLTTEFCDMENLTSSLSLEPNDVPLLLSVASTHSPEVTQRYGLSFR